MTGLTDYLWPGLLVAGAWLAVLLIVLIGSE